MDIGVDEAGRGPLFGRVYAAAVILPPELEDNGMIKDSKKIKNKAKLTSTAEFIKSNALAWGIGFATETEIDSSNILNATMTAMHRAIKKVLDSVDDWNGTLLIDGTYFKPYLKLTADLLTQLPHRCYEKGDSRIRSISAASILAKHARDDYIADLVITCPRLDECYQLSSNKGYGTQAHMAGLKKHGISEWHRKSFGLCKVLKPWVVGGCEPTRISTIQSPDVQGD